MPPPLLPFLVQGNYGGAKLNTSRIFFTFGRDDPWQSAWPEGAVAELARANGAGGVGRMQVMMPRPLTPVPTRPPTLTSLHTLSCARWYFVRPPHRGVPPSSSVLQRIECDDCAHCVDLGHVGFDEQPALRATRAAVMHSLQCWLELPGASNCNAAASAASAASS